MSITISNDVINVKQDAATTTAHSKRLISLLKDKKIIDNIIDYNMGKH